MHVGTMYVYSHLPSASVMATQWTNKQLWAHSRHCHAIDEERGLLWCLPPAPCFRAPLGRTWHRVSFGCCGYPLSAICSLTLCNFAVTPYPDQGFPWVLVFFPRRIRAARAKFAIVSCFFSVDPSCPHLRPYRGNSFDYCLVMVLYGFPIQFLFRTGSVTMST